MAGLYVYGITRQDGQTHTLKNIGLIGHNGKEITSIEWDKIAAITSLLDEDISLSKENLLTHIKVLDEILAQNFDVLPFKFGTVAENEVEVQNLLKDGYLHWLSLLDRVAGKVELTFQIFWLDFDARVKEIVNEDKALADLRDRMLSQQNYRMLITTGEVFKNILEDKKKTETAEILQKLMPLSAGYKENQYLNDANIANWSFLVERGKEKEFDEAVKQIEEDKKDRYGFKYYGPSPAFNFITK